MSSMEGLVALVTGCGRANGLGYAIAAAYAHAGGSVVLTDIELRGARNADEPISTHESGTGLDGLCGSLSGAGHDVLGLYGDVGNRDDAERMIASTISRYGRIDVLVNNAAAPQGADRNPIENVPDAAFESLVHVNLKGAFQMCKAVVPYMRANRFGRIINISSMYGRVGTPNSAVYSMTKAGILGLTRSLAVELAPQGITVNAICPGFVHTSRSESSMRRAGITDEKTWMEMGTAIPMGRRAHPSDIVSTALYLASRASGYITAQDITVDGGQLGF